MSSDMAPIRLALLGAGVFAKNAYIPTLAAMADRVQIVAVWSRSEGAAADLLPTVQQYWPGAKAYSGQLDLDHLLESKEIDAVANVLPAQPSLLVRQALGTVLSTCL